MKMNSKSQMTTSAVIKRKMNRRQALKWGALSGASTFFIMKRMGAGDPPPEPPLIVSPYTRPFIQELPIPPVCQPVLALDPMPDPADHQGGFGWGNPLLYEVRVREAWHSFHPNLPPSPIWGYDGIYPGPTLMARYGQPALVRFHNELPSSHVGYGLNEIAVHLHNAHSATESDGFPGDFFGVGKHRDNHYPFFYAGNDPREALGTLWYHDHRFDFTAQNAYKGLAGFCLLFDDRDSGNENDPNPDALRLPSGQFDVPLFFQDKVFDANGQLFFDLLDLDGMLGDRTCVNGKIAPFMKVYRRKYRFRMLNGGPSRFYEFFLSSGHPFTYIANDGNLLPAPLQMQSVGLGVAERAEVIIDFSQFNVGDSVYLENRLEQLNGRGPSGITLNPGVPLLRFDIVGDAPDPSQVPNQLRELPDIDLNEVVTTRTWNFDRTSGAWTINARIFNVNEVRASIQQGTAERWILRNGGGGWSHPIHIHFEEFRILSRNGQPPAAHEAGRKDVVVLGPGDEVEIFMRFRDFLGRYVMHCHNMVHEDHSMMLRWDIVS